MARDDRPPETLDPRRLRASLSSSLGLGGDGRRSQLARSLSPRTAAGEARGPFEAASPSEPLADGGWAGETPAASQPRARRSFTWEMPPDPDGSARVEPTVPFEPDIPVPHVGDDGFGRPVDVVADGDIAGAAPPGWAAIVDEPSASSDGPEPPVEPPPMSSSEADADARTYVESVPSLPSATATGSRPSTVERSGGFGNVVDPSSGRSAPIVPPQSVAGRALVAVVAIMGFLACLAVGVLSLVVSAAHDWQIDVGREVTIQIKPGDPAGLPARLSRTLDIARATPGVRSARLVDEREGAALLEPWLGQGLDLSALPIPRLVVIELEDPATADLSALRRRLSTEVTGALLDDHAVWTSRLRTMAGAVVVSGVSVVVLVLLAMSLTVVFATRSAMAGNRDVIEVLHFVGAEDVYVAEQFQRHFLRLGLIGGAIGGAAAVVVFQILRLLTRAAPGDAVADQARALFGGFSVGFSGHFGVLVVMGLVAALTAATSRFTVLDHLKRLD